MCLYVTSHICDGYMCLASLLITKNPKVRWELAIGEICAFTAVLGQILNQSIVSVSGFYKEKVALRFMENFPEQREFVCIILLFQWRG